MKLFHLNFIFIFLFQQLRGNDITSQDPCTGELPVPEIDTPIAAKLPKFERIIVLGDSLNDVNNLYTSTSGFIPNKKFYCKGRFSNGRLWVEFLHDLLEKKLDKKIDMVNYAVGGATTNNKLGFVVPMISSLLDQATIKLDQLKNQTKLSDFNNSLFTLWMGGNDYFLPDNTPEKVVNELENILTILLIKEKVQHLLLGDSPPINRPLQNNTVAQALVKDAMTKKHNLLLNQALDRVLKVAKEQHSLNPNVILFKTADYLTPLIRNETDVPLFEKPYVANKPCMVILDHKATVCKDPDNYVFWDRDHPSHKLHRLLGSEMFKLLVNGYL